MSFVVPLFVACNASQGLLLPPAYDLEALRGAASAEEVRAALPPESELAGAWTCGEIPSPLGAKAAGELWDRCDLGGLASRARFVAAPGDRVAAARLHRWLQAKGEPDPVRGPRFLLGEAPFEGDLALPEVPGLPASEVPPATTLAARLTGPGAWGRFPYWHLPGVSGAQALAVDASLPVSTLRFALASHAPDGRAVPILVLSDAGVTTFPLALPGDAPAQAVSFAPGQPLAAPPEGPVRVEVSDDATVGALLASVGGLSGRRVELSMDHDPCLDPPGPGMRCVPGGEGVGTFYVDEAADPDTAACRTAQVCRSAPGTWEAARELCTFRGKRLPTIFEAKRAELSSTPTWTWSWAGEGSPPHGVCDGAPDCRLTQQKLLTDGTAKLRSASVKAPPICVTSEPWLTTWPPAVITTPRPTRPHPAPPTQAELDIAWSVQSDDLADKGICGEEVRKNWAEMVRKGGRSTTACRDPYSYVTTNEPHRWLFEKFVANAGGIYVGVGSDQSYDYIAEQRPDWAFVFDYDPNVVRFHHVMQALLRAAPTRQAFVELWSNARKEEAEKLIETAWPEQAGFLTSFYYGYRSRIEGSMKGALEPDPAAPTFGFLATDENYAFIHLLAEQRRIVPVGVDMLDTVGMRSVGETCRKLGQPVRVYYTSNAPTAWGGAATPEYKANVRSLPMDDRSMVLATFNWGAWNQTGRWRYDIMHGLLQQERLGSDFYTDNRAPTWDRVPGDHGNLTVVGLPARFVPE